MNSINNAATDGGGLTGFATSLASRPPPPLSCVVRLSEGLRVGKPRTKAKLPESRFILHRFNGDEVYRFEKAVIWAYVKEPGVTLWFEVSADANAIQRCEDTAEMGMSPNAEVGIDLPELDADQLVGRTFLIPGAKSDDEDSCMSLLYYCEHEALRDNHIRIVSREGDKFWLYWTAVVQDVNYYDGSKPATQVEIEGEFVFKDIAEWVRA
jgi:hypothetical protein